jgi:actin-related protein
MYCGDETGSFIGEIGSHTCRFGYGGEDNPKLVVPSYTIRDEHDGNVSSKSKRRMSVSSLHDLTKNERLESILRMPPHHREDCDSMHEISKILPQTDPNVFLRQGDSVQNWDSFETAWETSMVTLRATDTRKHTTGGSPYEFHHKNGGLTSSTVKRSTDSAASTRCVHPLLAITPGMTHLEGVGKEYMAAHKRQQYTKYVELFMESLQATSIFLATAPMLASFSLGRQTALIVDLGAGGCRVTPVADGLVLQQSQRRNGRGGDWLGNVTWKAFMEEYDTVPQPRYILRGTNRKNQSTTQALWYRRAMTDLMYEVRTEPFVKVQQYNSSHKRVPFVKQQRLGVSSSSSSLSPPDSPLSATDISPSNYHLPDGSTVNLLSSFGKDLQHLPELLFADTLPFAESPPEPQSNTLHTTFSNAPLHKLVQESLLAVGDVDVRKELTGSICLVGGSSLFPTLDTRLSQELSALLPSFVKPKVVASRFSVERSCAAWIGGSILTSLGSFQQLWLSLAEYEEYGATMAIQRFPQ